MKPNVRSNMYTTKDPVITAIRLKTKVNKNVKNAYLTSLKYRSTLTLSSGTSHTNEMKPV